MSISTSLDESWMEYMQTRRPKLREALIMAYVPFVRFVVGRLGIPATGVLDIEDLISYGMIGLINAVDRYDPARGVRFEVFATPRIRGAVIDQLRSLNWLPRSAMARVRQIEGAIAELEQRLGRLSSEEEVAREIGVSVERYRQMLQEVSTTVLSLDAPLGAVSQEDEVVALSDLLEDQEAIGPAAYTERREMRHLLCEAVERLPERERLVLALYYQREMTMKEISRRIGVSESRICQLHIQAITHLRVLLAPTQTDEARSEGEQQKVLAWTARANRARKRATLVRGGDELMVGMRSQRKVS